MAKAPATVYVCQKCGHQSRKWLGKCPDCGEWNSLVEERARLTPKKESVGARGWFGVRDITSTSYSEIESQDDARVSSGLPEFDRVLGGGFVPGSLVLIGGEPGIGKSTLLLQAADKMSAQGMNVLYVSGEESERQIKMRGERLGLKAENVYLLPETGLDGIFREIERTKPDVVIVDSIQTAFSSDIESAPGSRPAPAWFPPCRQLLPNRQHRLVFPAETSQRDSPLRPIPPRSFRKLPLRWRRRIGSLSPARCGDCDDARLRSRGPYRRCAREL